MRVALRRCTRAMTIAQAAVLTSSLLLCGARGVAQEPAPVEISGGTASEADSAPTEAAAPATPQDASARIYMMKCAGCHTIGGGALSGPDLKNASTYPRETVLDGIRRMEKNVGPLTEEEVERLADLILAPDAAARLEEQRRQVQMQELATLEPASAAAGRALFFGQVSFAQGGVSCSACHQAGGRGGNLAASLEDAFKRLGEEPLLATTESPGFPVMRAIYDAHPVTRQEARHVVKYLEEVSASPVVERHVPVHVASVTGSIAVLVLLELMTKKRAAGTRARMVADASSRSNRCGGNKQ